MNKSKKKFGFINMKNLEHLEKLDEKQVKIDVLKDLNKKQGNSIRN